MRLGLTLSICSILWAGQVSAQVEEPPPEYRQFIEEAVSESAAGRWLEARILFRHAHEVYPNARTLRGIGMTSYEIQDYSAAYRALSASLTEQRRALDAEQRTQVEALLSRVSELIARYTVEHLGPDVEITVDGLPRMPDADGTLIFEHGRHEIAASFPGDLRDRATLVVRGGEVGPLPLSRPEPQAPPPAAVAAATVAATDAPRTAVAAVDREESARRRRLAGQVLLGGGAASVVAGVALLVVGLNDVSTVEDAASGTEWSSIEDSYDRSAAFTGVGITLLAIGGAAAVAGLVFTLRESDEGSAAITARVQPGGARMEVNW